MLSFLSQRLAGFISSLAYEDLPPEVLRRVKMNLLDTIGISIYASDMPWSKIIVDQVDELGGASECTIIGHTKKN
jgi:2-methylcitrate dehydratase PrpD